MPANAAMAGQTADAVGILGAEMTEKLSANEQNIQNILDTLSKNDSTFKEAVVKADDFPFEY
jgi:hypothetical protein